MPFNHILALILGGWLLSVFVLGFCTFIQDKRQAWLADERNDGRLGWSFWWNTTGDLFSNLREFFLGN
jgi:hypothetical protein